MGHESAGRSQVAVTATGQGRSQVTISDIAAEIGVSVPTVSKVLNGRSDVSASTRDKVEQALERHRYQRRPRVSTSDSMPLLDLVFHNLGSPWSMEIILGVQAAATDLGVGVVLTSLGGSHSPGESWIDEVMARRPRGVILVMSNLDPKQRHQLESRNIRYVVVDTDGETPQDVPTVGSNNWHGGLSATRHLLELGHRRIAVISGPEDVLCSRARIDGFRGAHDEAGIAVDPALVRWGDFGVDGGYRNAQELLSATDRPTAIFAGSDVQALGVIRAAHEVGLTVPGDLSVVGYDDLPLSQWCHPTLTTVHQPLNEMAGTATRTVLDAGADKRPPLRIELATHMVIRESTAPPR
jgi:LacI family transcriptional regulator